MKFNGIDLADRYTSSAGGYFIVNDVRGRGVLGNEVDMINVPGRDGSYVVGKRRPPRALEVDITIKGDSYEDLRKKIEDLNALLSTETDTEIVFDDEPDRVYYGRLTEVNDKIEKSKIYQATLTFICPDPFKYGPEKVYQTDQDTFIVENEGTVPTKPIFELTCKQPVTFAMVSDGERYNMIGRPADVEQDVVAEKVVVLDEVGDTIDTWQPASGFNGTFVHGSQGIQVGNWGSGSGWHGPGAIKEIDPIQDFEIEFFVYVRSTTPDRTFRISTNFFDENMNELGMVRLWDNSDRILRKVVEARVGPYVDDFINYPISSRNYDIRNQTVWGGIIRVIRKGNVFTFYAARITQAGRHVSTITQTFADVNNQFAGKLKFIRIDIANYGNTEKPNEAVINRIRVFEHKKVEVDQTPYIAYSGDVITFDYTTNELLLNGEDAKRLKDFGGEYFDLPKGFTTLTVLPENAFDTKIRFKPRYR